MLCDTIRAALSSFDICELTEAGARVPTHCLYPSFEQVHVFVAKFGDGYKIHDGGGALREAWLHGRDDHVISSVMRKEAARYHVELIDGSLVASIESKDWLSSAILAVANASSFSALAAVQKIVAAAEEALIDRIDFALRTSFEKKSIIREFTTRGKSGKEHRFDIALFKSGDGGVLINAVSPHHNSVAAKYVAFSDTEGENVSKFAVYDRPLATDDVALMQQVAEIVPFDALIPGALRAFPLHSFRRTDSHQV